MSDSSTPASTEGVAQHVGNVDGLSMTLSLCLCYTLCFACLRVYIRWRAYGPDDLVVLLSTVRCLSPNLWCRTRSFVYSHELR